VTLKNTVCTICGRFMAVTRTFIDYLLSMAVENATVLAVKV
jgi:hypothetical protein